MRKTMVFNSQEEYESWTEKFENCSDYQMIPTIVDNGWKLSADLFTECKSWKTVIRRFKKAFSDYKPVQDWIDCIYEMCENGFFSCHSDNDYEDYRDGYAFEIEETSEGLWYMFLNISGVYAK